MRTLQVQFTSGREVLSSYWGLLSGGGLSIDLTGVTPPCAAGERVRLHVYVCSIKKTYELDVQVVDVRRLDEEALQAIVSFLPSRNPGELLDAAWADGCDAPQRRSRRLPLHTEVRYERLDGGEMAGRIGHLVNLSAGGCCVEGAALPPPGTQVLLTTPPEANTQVKMVGRVRWTERPEGGLMGIEFLRPAPDILALLETLVPINGTGNGEKP